MINPVSGGAAGVQGKVSDGKVTGDRE